MKNIFPGLFLILVFLPQVSFGQNQTADATTPTPAVISPAEAYCIKQIDAESIQYFQQLGAERTAWMASHHDLVLKQDQMVKDWAAKRDAQRQEALSTNNPSLMPIQGEAMPHLVDPDNDAFVAKQHSEQQAFLAQLNIDKQKCLQSQGAAS